MNRRPPHARDARPHRNPVSRVVRDRNRKKPDVANWLRIALVAVMAAQCLRVAFTSPRLQLREVRVAGSERLATAEVVRLGGIPVGQNIFRVNLVRVAEQLRDVPYLREVVVTRELPSTVSVELREREPAIQVLSGGKAFHADREGVLFQTAPTLSAEMPRLEVQAKDLPPVGGKLPAELVRAVWECDRLSRSEDLTVRSLRVDGAGELWLNIATIPTGDAEGGQLDVVLGRGTELPQKFRDIRHSLAGWPDLTTRASYLNVMCAGRPAYLRMTKETSTE